MVSLFSQPLTLAARTNSIPCEFWRPGHDLSSQLAPGQRMECQLVLPTPTIMCPEAPYLGTEMAFLSSLARAPPLFSSPFYGWSSGSFHTFTYITVKATWTFTFPSASCSNPCSLQIPRIELGKRMWRHAEYLALEKFGRGKNTSGVFPSRSSTSA